jgi:hypothetical protein
MNKTSSSVSRALKNPIYAISSRGKVIENLKPNDHIICDVESDDIWIKFQIIIESDHFVEAELEVKMDKSINKEGF